jgi:single-strand DNA-binding protein
MADNVITIVGNLTEDPELRYTQNGVAVTNVRVAVNRRFRNNQTNEWEDRLDGYFTVNVWRDQAENVAESLAKGSRVMVQGRLISRSYEDKEKQTRWVTEIEADEVCPSLRWARAKVEKVSRGGSGGAGGGGGSTNQSWGGGSPTPPAATPPDPDDVPF